MSKIFKKEEELKKWIKKISAYRFLMHGHPSDLKL